MDSTVYREMRWFLEGPIPDEARDWFAALPGKMVKRADPRQDIYLVIPGRDDDDLGLKNREGRLEIKTRSDRHDPYTVVKGRIAGFPEVWTKDTWNFVGRIAKISKPFKKGLRVRVTKSRIQKEYAVERGALVPLKKYKRKHKGKSPSASFTIELTELRSQANDARGDKGSKRRHWTIGCDASASSKRIKKVLETGAQALLESYDGPPLRQKDSYGYPQFARKVAAEH